MSRLRAVGVLLAALAVVAGAGIVVDRAAGADGPRLSASGSAVQLVSDHEGRSLLGGANLRPGATVTGTVTLTNVGDEAGAGALALTGVVDEPGPSGVGLLDHLVLTVRDADADVVLFRGAPAALPTALALGRFAQGAVRRFRVDATVGEDAGQGARASLGLVWTLTGEGGDATQATPGAGAAPPVSEGTGASVLPAPIPAQPSVRADGRLGLQVRAARRQRQRRGRLALSVRCARPCTVAVRRTVTGVRARTVTRRLKANRWTRITIVSPRRRRARLTVRATGGGQRAQVVLKVLVRPPGRP